MAFNHPAEFYKVQLPIGVLVVPLNSTPFIFFSNFKGDSRIQVRIQKEVIQQIFIDYFLSHLLTFVGHLLIICWIFVNNCLLERHS